MSRWRNALALSLALLAWPAALHAQPQTVGVTYRQALASARVAAPDLAVARGQEHIAEAEVGVAGVYPNPSFSVATSTQAARFSAGASIPLIIFGQRGAAMDASRAELATVRVETEAVYNDVRSATARAFIDLWLAQKTAAARADGAQVATRIEAAVVYLVEKGKSPETDSLRVHAERLRADADAQEAEGLVDVAASELSRWIGSPGEALLRAEGDPDVPVPPPPLSALAARLDGNPQIRREQADARAAEARADRERALVRPTLSLDLGFDAYDPTLVTPCTPQITVDCGGTPPVNYRAGLTLDVPLFNQRGPMIDRERAAADAARTRASAEHTRQLSALVAAYRTFLAVSARVKALDEAVVPAAEAAAARTEEAHTLGYAPLFAVLDAEKARIDAKITLLEARAARANAWVDVQHATGGPS
jgi:cobalt-zinc-cadmium efflux system outer membrane protein